VPNDNNDILNFGLRVIMALVLVEIIYLVADSVLRLISPSTHLPDMGKLVVAIAIIGFYGIRYRG